MVSSVMRGAGWIVQRWGGAAANRGCDLSLELLQALQSGTPVGYAALWSRAGCPAPPLLHPEVIARSCKIVQ